MLAEQQSHYKGMRHNRISALRCISTLCNMLIHEAKHPVILAAVNFHVLILILLLVLLCRFTRVAIFLVNNVRSHFKIANNVLYFRLGGEYFGMTSSLPEAGNCESWTSSILFWSFCCCCTPICMKYLLVNGNSTFRKTHWSVTLTVHNLHSPPLSRSYHSAVR